jgi:anti-sigma factor RsiW
MSTERIPRSDKDLWRKLATDRNVASTAVTDIEFAAWLEGRLPEAAAARVEAAVAADPELRRAALELADILGKPLPAAPARMAVRAQALVGFEAERRAGRTSWVQALLPLFGRAESLQRGAMAGAAVLLAAVGFMMGGGLGASYAQERSASTRATVITVNPFGADSTNDLDDLFASNL